MRLTRLIFLLLLVLLQTPASMAFLGNAGQNNTTSPPTNSIIVKFSSDTGIRFTTGKAGVASVGVAAADEINRRHKIKNVAPLIQKAKASSIPAPFKNVMLVSLPDNADIDAVMAEYRALPGVEYVEPEYMAELHDLSDDTYLQHQWGIHNEGQPHYFIVRKPGDENDKMVIVNGLAGADINTAGVIADPPSNTVDAVLAIIDTGVDIDHPDLEGKIWHNPGEIAGNEIDDDHNGFVDDIYGWDFSPSVDNFELEDNDPTDYFGHGTHCAGIAAAVADNGIGVMGATPPVKIMALKIFPAALTSKMARAIIYAADNGADVVNMSWGFSYRSYLIEDACAYAHSKGVVLCASSGNNGVEEYNCPSSFETTIAVGASNDSDRVAYFSSYGEHIDVVAPGLAILSLRADRTDMYDENDPYVHIVGEQYYLSSGTSMSGPFVAAAAAYLRAVSPGLTPARSAEVIRNAADDYIDPFGDGGNFPGRDIYSGYGRLNLHQTLLDAPGVRAVIDTPYIGDIVGGTVEIRGIADGSEFTSYSVGYGAGVNPSEFIPIHQSDIPVTDNMLAEWNTSGISGRYTIRLKAGDDNECKKTVFVANEAAAAIISPAAGDTVSNIIDIVADAYAPDFGYMVLDYGYGETPDEWTEIATGSIPASNDIISDWLVESLPEGEYTLRLSVYSRSKLETQGQVLVYVRSVYSGDNAWKIKLDGGPSILANYGDIDGDDINEIIVGTSEGLAIFEPDGTPDNTDIAVNIGNIFIVPPAVGRLDNDAIDDFVAVGTGPAKLYGFRSAAADFEYPVYTSPNVNEYSQSEFDFTTLFLKDIDGDGIDEIHLVVVDNFIAVTYMYDAETGLVRTFDSVSVYLPLDMDGDGMDEFYTYVERSGLIRRHDSSGNMDDSLFIEKAGERFFCRGMTAYDIDGDDLPELMVYGFYSSSGYHLYAYDENFNLKAGWPNALGIDSYLVPTVPIIGDIDGDGDLEYFSVNFDLSYSYVHAWNLDGSPSIPGNPDGFLTTIPRPGRLNMPLLGDVNSDGQVDIVACANDDLFFTYRVQRIYAWDLSGDLHDAFPVITVPHTPFTPSSSYRYVPTVGDIDKNGEIDMVMPTADSSLVFLNFEGVLWDADKAPAPLWRYNRRLNGIGAAPGSQTAVDDHPAPLPERFSLGQNYPNPFNPQTRIEFSLPSKSRVTINIYDILGRKIKTLTDKILPAGEHGVLWNGDDDDGNPSASGIYLYRIEAGEYIRARKMVLVK